LAPRTQAATGASAPQVKSPPARHAIGDVEAEFDALCARLREAGAGLVESATLLELMALGVDWRCDALAAVALEMARQLDGRNSATAKSMCAGRLQEALDRLRELHPLKQEDSPLDEIRARRDQRIAAAQS